MNTEFPHHAPRTVFFSCSVGIMAYNEGRNIGHLLERLLQQRLEQGEITEIIVVASGCTDDTEEIVTKFAEKHSKIRLITEPTRRGKASGVQRFLDAARENLLVLAGADTLPEYDAVGRLLSPFADESVGMSGAHPVPLNPRNNFCGYVAHFFWEMHHYAALRAPKCGEMVAFRRLIDHIPEDVVVDEPYIAAMVLKKGLRVVYQPDAVVYNMGPGTVREILMRRRNIVAGYFHLSRRYGLRIPDRNKFQIAAILLKKVFSFRQPPPWVVGAAAIELLARILGWWDSRFGRCPLHLWRIAESTKTLIGAERK